jgi:acyl-CoA thioester hydrolase/thioesterase-3
MNLGRTRFETEMQVRPDDLDMNQHVHASRYQDYVLAARYDQMARCYGMSMEEFFEAGLVWYVKTAHLEYKRGLKLGEHFTVRTWVDAVAGADVKVCFEILRKSNGKLCCHGWFDYMLVNVKSGRPENIPDPILQKYTV